MKWKLHFANQLKLIILVKAYNQANAVMYKLGHTINIYTPQHIQYCVFSCCNFVLVYTTE